MQAHLSKHVLVLSLFAAIGCSQLTAGKKTARDTAGSSDPAGPASPEKESDADNSSSGKTADASAGGPAMVVETSSDPNAKASPSDADAAAAAKDLQSQLNGRWVQTCAKITGDKFYTLLSYKFDASTMRFVFATHDFMDSACKLSASAEKVDEGTFAVALSAVKTPGLFDIDLEYDDGDPGYYTWKLVGAQLFLSNLDEPGLDGSTPGRRPSKIDPNWPLTLAK